MPKCGLHALVVETFASGHYLNNALRTGLAAVDAEAA